MLLERSLACLLIVDVQERLLPTMHEAERVEAKCRLLLRAAEQLNLPVLVSEQYPKGLGPTVKALASNQAMIFSKLSFSVLGSEEIRGQFLSLKEVGVSQVVMCGIESHVCVLQSAADLRQAGFDVYVVADAISSRSPESVELALTRMRGFGVQVINTEMAVFELAGKAGTPEFKALSALIK